MLPPPASRSHAPTIQPGASHVPARCKKPHRPSAPAQSLPVIIRQSLYQVVSMARPRGSSYHTPLSYRLTYRIPPSRIYPPRPPPFFLLHPLTPLLTSRVVRRGARRSSPYLYNAPSPCALLSSLQSSGAMHRHPLSSTFRALHPSHYRPTFWISDIPICTTLS